MNLTKKQVQHLKALAHHLNPVVMIGNNGLTEGADAIVRETGAYNVQIIGKILVLYRPSEARKIILPK